MLFDEPLSDATVEVGGDDVATTDGNGTAMVTVPNDDEVEVEVKSEDEKLELELEDAPRPANGAEGTSVASGDGPFRIVVTAADGTEVLNTTVDPGTDFEIEFETEDGKTKVKVEQGEDEFEMEREHEGDSVPTDDVETVSPMSPPEELLAYIITGSMDASHKFRSEILSEISYLCSR